jgi:hypothetical protein
MKRLFLIFPVALLVLSGCGGDEGKECGAGTVKQGGECVPLILDCAPGTRPEGFECVPMCDSGEVWNGTQCVLAAECAPGTVLQGDQCVPACGTDEYWDGTACADVPECDTGTTFNPQTGRCEINETVCAPGTRLDNGVCVPEGNPVADVYETGDPDELAPFDLPAAGQSTSLGGVIDTPEDINGDGYEDANWDGFEFEASAGTWLRITATSHGAALPAFLLGSTTRDLDTYIRYAVNPNGLETVREFYLPYDDTYVIWVSDYNHVMAYVFGYSPTPVGGDDFTYYLTVENLGTPTPVDITTATYTDSGDLTDGRLHFYSLASLVGGDMVKVASAGLPVPDVQSDVYAALMLFDAAGNLVVNQEVYRTDETADVVYQAQSSNDILVVLDYLLLVGANRDYLFSAKTMQADNCTTGDCSTGDIPADSDDLLSWDLNTGELLAVGVYLPVPATEDDYRVLKISLLDENMNYILEDQYIDFQYVAVARPYADHNMRVYLWLREVYGLEVPEYTIEETLFDTPELQDGGDYTGLAVREFPPYTYYPAGVDHIVGEAGKLMVMNAFTPQGTWDTPREQIFTTALDASPDLDEDWAPDPIGPAVDVSSLWFPDSPITPVFFYARTSEHYLHYVDDLYGAVPGNTYDVGVRTVEPTDLGAPTVGQPVRLDYQSISGWDFYSFTAHKNQWTEISVYQRGFSDIQAQVWVFNFGAVVWDWIYYLWLPDPNAERLGTVTIETAAAAGEDITVGYNSPYDGMSLVLIQDALGQAGFMDLFDIEVSIPAAPGNDACADAETVTLSGGSASISGDSRSATDTVTEGVCDGYVFDSGPEVFYKLTLNAGDTIDITLDGLDFNEALYLFTDCADVTGSTVAFSNEASPEVINYEVPAGAGGLHYIGVDACGQGGSFTLDITVNGP